MALITVTGHVFDPSGAAQSSVPVLFELINAGSNTPYVSGSNVIAPTSLTVLTNGSGIFSASLQGNDTITPSGTLYRVTFNNNKVSVYSFTGSGPINLDATASLGPSSPVGSPFITLASVGTPNGICPLDGNSLVPASKLPASSSGVSLGFDVTKYGAVADAQIVTDATGNSSNNQVTSATANFKVTDVGKLCYFIQGNSFNLFTAATILSVQSSTTVTVSAAIPGGGNYPGTFVWGTDNSTAFANAATAAIAASIGNGLIVSYVYIPQGNFIVNANPTINGQNKISVRGAGKNNTNLYVSPNFPYSNTGGGNIFINVFEVADLGLQFNACNLSLGNISLIGCSILRRVRIQDWRPTSGGNNVCVVMPSDDGISEDFDIFTTGQGLEIASLHHVMFRGEISANGDTALAVVDTANVQIVDSHISGNIGIQDGPNQGMSNWHITNSRIAGASSAIKLTTNGSVLRLENCFVEGTPAVTITAGPASSSLTAASNASGGFTTYTGTFSFPFGPTGDSNNMLITIAGFTNAGNNGTFAAVSCNSTTLVVANPNGVSETHAGTATWNQTIYAGNCDFVGNGANCISNAGVFFDLGGNTFAGTFTGAGTYSGPTFSSALLGFGNGTAGTGVTTTTKGTGTGPAAAQTIVDYIPIQIPINGSYQKFWIPLMQ